MLSADGASAVMEENVKEKKKRQQIHEFDLTKDIRYRGPLSYRSFKIFGWICCAHSFIADNAWNVVSGFVCDVKSLFLTANICYL